MGYPCPVPQEGQVREREGPKVPFKRPNFIHEDLRISDLMLQTRCRTLFFSNLLVLSQPLI